MLEVMDPRWSQLGSNYTNGEHVAQLIGQAQAGAPFDDWYDDLFQELCHQYTVSEAAYAALPHLVRQAKSRPDCAKELLILAGACYGYSQATQMTPIPPDLEAEWNQATRQAIPLLGNLLAQPQASEVELRYLLSSLAAMNGCPALANAIDGLDCDIECPNCGTIVKAGH
jgi:hypothetical protein